MDVSQVTINASFQDLVNQEQLPTNFQPVDDPTDYDFLNPPDDSDELASTLSQNSPLGEMPSE